MSLDPGALAPVRNPNLIRRVWSAVVSSDPAMGPQAAQQSTSESGVLNVQAAAEQRTIYQLGVRTRQAIYSDADEMDTTSPEFARALHTIANNVTASEDGEQQSFTVECEDAGALQVLDDTIEAADLHGQMPSWTRRTVKYGDGFAEIVVNSDLDVVAVKQLPSATMFRNEDEYGNLRLGTPRYADRIVQNARDECAFEQTDEQGKRLVATFYPWQIAHTRLFWDGVDPYGVSLAKVGRNVWRKLNSLENSMVIARLTRAYLKLIVYADGTGMSADEKRKMLKQLMTTMTQTGPSIDQKRNHEISVLDNIYMAVNYTRPQGSASPMPSLTKVDLIDPKNEGLTSLDDVDHFHRQYVSSLFVPPAMMGFEEDVNARATLSGEALQFARFLRSTQQVMGAAVEQVLDTALILKGYDPAQVDYEIHWPVISSEDEQQMAVANFQQAQADDIYLQAGAIDREWVQKHRFEMDDDEIADIEEPEPEVAPVLPMVSKVQPEPKPVAAEHRERIMPALEVLAVAQQRILDRMDQPSNGNGHVLAEVAASSAPNVEAHVHFEKGAIQNDVTHKVDVQPADVHIPDVTVNVPDHPQPDVHVHTPKQDAPQVKVDVQAPSVHVASPPPAEVTVNVEIPKPKDAVIERNRDGSIKGITHKGG